VVLAQRQLAKAVARLAPRWLLLGALLGTLLGLPGATSAQNITEPNDPLFPKQWALPHVGASCAWASTIGSADVTVAVVDSGVDLKHPDLVDRLRDDGRDFVDNDNDPSDKNGHGTNVAGIVAATLDNGEGVAGLAPGVRILPVRVMNDRGFGSDRAIARGVRFAADQGAQVINLSLGATLSIGADSESPEVTAAIRYAQSKGSLVVAAAGNDFVPLPNAIVGDNPDVLVVAATDDEDRKAPFSNSGPWIAVAAPGVHILSTMPTYEVYLTSDKVPDDERFSQNYDYMSGTSQATPYVSALAALLFSAHPDWTAQQVGQAIKASAVDISRQNRRVKEGYLGNGRMDACAALEGAQGSAPAQPPTAAPARPTRAPAARPTATRPTAAARPSVVAVRPTSASAARATPLPSNAVEPESPGSSASAVGLGGLACLVLLVLLVLVGALRLFRRGPRPYVPPGQPGTTTPQPVPVGPSVPSTGWGALTVVSGAARPGRFPLTGVDNPIGRSPDCAVVLVGDETVSRRHALVRNDGQHVTVEDLGSSHGTFLNGQRLVSPAAVRRGDVLQIGQTLLRFE